MTDSSIQPSLSQIIMTDQERDQMTIGPSISTITFMRGDIDKAITYFREKVQAIVNANPWLAGRLNKKGKLLSCDYNAESPSIDDIFITPDIIKNQNNKNKTQLKLPIINTKMSYYDLCAIVGGSICELPNGTVQISKKSSLMRLSIIPDSKGAPSYAVVVSLSHVICDGFTYYKIMSMLNSTTTSTTTGIESMNAIRKSNLKELADKAMGSEESRFTNSGATVCNVVTTMLCSNKKPYIGSYMIDNNKIESIKSKSKTTTSGGSGSENTKDAVEYVTTNDIIASSFGNISGCKVLLLPINFRNKIKDFNDHDSGNYEGALVFGREDFYEPSLIRKTLNSGLLVDPPEYKRCSDGRLPSGSEACCNTRLGMCVSWCFEVWDEMSISTTTAATTTITGRDNEMSISESIGEHTQILHVPISDIKMIPFECALIYKPLKGKRAVTFFTRCITDEGLVKGMPIGKEITTVDSML